MSISDMKQLLHEKIEQLNDEQVPVVQKFFEEIETNNAKQKPSMQEIWKELVEQYDDTLRRLAQ